MTMMQGALLRLVPDLGGGLIDEDYDQALVAGLVRYSTDIPAQAWVELSGDGPWPLPPDWRRRSRITCPDHGLCVHGGMIHRTGTIRLASNLNVGYTRQWTAETVPSEDREAVLRAIRDVVES